MQAWRAVRATLAADVRWRGTAPTPARRRPARALPAGTVPRATPYVELNISVNFRMDAERRLCMLLVGLTELRRRLSMAVHESVSQRLVVRHHIGSLDRDELDAYLEHRLRLAGCELPLFEPPAVEALFQSSRGLPRQINRTAHYALSAAALAKARTVDAEHMQHALDELRP